MKLIAVAALFAALFALLAEASPTRTSQIPDLLARSSPKKQTPKDCKPTEFFYSTRSCCLTKGGPKKTPNPPSGVECPKSWYYYSKQGCCVPRNKPGKPTTPTCPTKGWMWSKGLQCCKKPPPHTTAPPSQPSGGYDKKHRRRSVGEEFALAMCPTEMDACPILVNGIPSGDSECVDPQDDVNNCGGCASTQRGAVCSTGQQCVSGECVSNDEPEEL